MKKAGNTTGNLDDLSCEELISEILSLRESLEKSQHNEELYLEQIKALKKGAYGRKSEEISNIGSLLFLMRSKTPIRKMPVKKSLLNL